MSITPVTGISVPGPQGPRATGGPTPRVRHLAREAATLMAFSAATSASIAGCLLLLTSLGR